MLTLNLSNDFPGLYNYRNRYNIFQTDAGLSYVNSKKNLEIKIMANDLFKTSGPKYYYYSNGIKQIYENYYDSRMIKMLVSWKIGNWHNKSNKQLESSNIEEKGRL
jgi:hypothetical protein